MAERRTIAHLALDAEHRFGERTMVHRKERGSWLTHSFAEMAALRRQVTAGLFERGIKKGDRVGVLCTTRYEWSLCDGGAMGLGAVVVGIYPTVTPSQLAYILSHSGCRVLVVESTDALRQVQAIRAEVPSLELIVLIDGQAEGDDVISFARLLQGGDAALARDPGLTDRLRDDVRPEDTATLVYTSGTTGDPKGVVLKQGALFDIARSQAEVAELTDEDVAVAFLPMAHILGRVAGYSALLIGLEIWFAESLEKAPETWTIARPTTMALVPRFFEKVHDAVLTQVETLSPARQRIFHRAIAVGLELRRIEREGRRPSLALRAQARLFERLVYRRLRERVFGDRVRYIFSGSAPLASELLEFFHAVGILILEGYGLTETCSPATLNRPDAYRFGTVGQAMPGVEVRIADDGEVLLKSPGMFAGYFQDGDATRAAFTEDGWFRTGDIGERDEDGFVRITDRKKDIIITAGGKNIAPQNLEVRLRREPGVSQAMVHGDRRKYLVALITVDEEALIDVAPQERERMIEEGVQRVNADLARYETIKRYAIVDEDFTIDNGLLTPSLKVRRRAVERRYQAVLDGLYEAEAGA